VSQLPVFASALFDAADLVEHAFEPLVEAATNLRDRLNGLAVAAR
jgi:hypothetical protein